MHKTYSTKTDGSAQCSCTRFYPLNLSLYSCAHAAMLFASTTSRGLEFQIPVTLWVLRFPWNSLLHMLETFSLDCTLSKVQKSSMYFF